MSYPLVVASATVVGPAVGVDNGSTSAFGWQHGVHAAKEQCGPHDRDIDAAGGRARGLPQRQRLDGRPGSVAALVVGADRQCQSLFGDGEMVASLYASSQRVRQMSGVLRYGVLKHETDTWAMRFDAMITELKGLKPFIERPGVIMVPDTSALLEGKYFTELDWQALAGAGSQCVRLVVPVVVVEELDTHKRGRDRQRDRAVSVLRQLWELGGSDPERIAHIPGRPVTAEVFLDGPWHVRRAVNDDEIIERALAVGEITGQDVMLVAADFAMLYRASAAGLRAVLVPRPDESGGDSAG
jgi:hypothetical protein